MFIDWFWFILILWLSIWISISLHASILYLNKLASPLLLIVAWLCKVTMHHNKPNITYLLTVQGHIIDTYTKWWRHDMEMLSTLLALCVGNP